MSGIITWNWNRIIFDDVFACNEALYVMNDDEDHEPKSSQECRKRDD